MQTAQIQRLDEKVENPIGKPLEVQFNPTEFTLNKGVQYSEIGIPGLDSPILQFVRGQNETLSLDLFFDSTDQGMGDSAVSVTHKTDLFYQLIKIDPKKHAPPICRFVWGKGDFPGAHFENHKASEKRQNGFDCVVESVRQRFTLFSPKGVPLRATLTVSLREYKTLSRQLEELNKQSADHIRIHVYQEGETLSRLAADVYDDPAQWRRIAEENQIEDPLSIPPGAVLVIPPLAERVS